MPVTKFESLPPEVFYVIFSYMDAYYILQRFYGLNSRLDLIIDGTKKLHLEWETYYDAEESTILKKLNLDKIISLNISNDMLFGENLIQDFFINFPLETIFVNLHSLKLSSLYPKNYPYTLEKLSSLTKLRKLTINLIFDTPNVYKKYAVKIIFDYLPLSVTHLSLDDTHFFYDYPIYITYRYHITCLEYLQLDHLFFNDFINLLSYIPYIKSISAGLWWDDSEEQPLPLVPQIPLTKLTNIRFSEFGSLPLDTVKMFLLNCCPNLNSLQIKTWNIPYADGYEWEDVISKLLNLKKFYFELHTVDTPESLEWNLLMDNCVMPRFETTFWLERDAKVRYERESNTKFVLEVNIN